MLLVKRKRKEKRKINLAEENFFLKEARKILTHIKKEKEIFLPKNLWFLKFVFKNVSKNVSTRKDMIMHFYVSPLKRELLRRNLGNKGL